MANLLPLWVTCHLTCPVVAASLNLKSKAVALGEQPVYQGPVHCIATIVRTEGLAGLYQGAGAMMLRDVPGYCLYFIPYVFLTDWITPEACADPSPYAVWLAGGVAGKIAALIPVPVLVTAVEQLGQGSNKSMLNTYCVPEKGLGIQDSPHSPFFHLLSTGPGEMASPYLGSLNFQSEDTF